MTPVEQLEEADAIPAPVQQCARLLADIGVWCKFSRNAYALSCRDAAKKRNRLGHIGIPLWDELKSFLGEYSDADGRTQLFLAHCRGDRTMDMAKILREFGEQASGCISRLTNQNGKSNAAEYGTVNPFKAPGIRQIFDVELSRPLGVPGTVMTNAGEHTWGVEFDPVELINRLPNTVWSDIVMPAELEPVPDYWGVREPSPIGVLTGNPMDSGLFFCEMLLTHIRRLLARHSLGDVSMPKVIMVSTPHIGISMETDDREVPLRASVLNGIDELCSAGSRIIVHPAHTTHYFAADIAEQAATRGARFVSLVDSLVQSLRTDGIKEIALLGTKQVTDISDPRSPYNGVFGGITVHTPSPGGWRKIHQLAYDLQQSGTTSKCFNIMRDILREEVPMSCEHVVLAMTEFTSVLRQLKERGRQGKTLIDPLDSYAKMLAHEYLGLRPALTRISEHNEQVSV